MFSRQCDSKNVQLPIYKLFVSHLSLLHIIHLLQINSDWLHLLIDDISPFSGMDMWYTVIFHNDHYLKNGNMFKMGINRETLLTKCLSLDIELEHSFKEFYWSSKTSIRVSCWKVVESHQLIWWISYEIITTKITGNDLVIQP